MTNVLTGACQCGSVKYRMEASIDDVVACHCKGCQRQSGSAFGLSLDVPRSAFRILSGELGSFIAECDSGRTKECAFCVRCGSRIYNEGEWGMSIKAGTLDETRELVPKAHYWTQNKQRWVSISESALTFEDDG